MNGVNEQAQAFDHADAFIGLSRFRRFGAEGPLYEVISRQGDRLKVRVVESGEELRYPVSAAETDPIA